MPHTPVAIVGASALFPGSTDSVGFWRDILAGRDLITDVPPSHWLVEDYYDPDPSAPDKTYAKRGAFLSNVPFDPMEFGVPPSILPATDTSQLLALIVAQRVLDDATQGQFAAMNRERASVILGVTSGQELLSTMVSRLQRPIWLKALRESGIPEDEAKGICDRIAREYVPWQESTFPGLLGNVVAGRIANRFDLRGTNCVTDAACASTLSALSMGLAELATGQSDLVIAGGVDTMNDIFMYMCFSKTPALSKSGDCRPFADAADGTLLGEGMAMVALKRLADAERDGDRVYAVIRGIGSSSDGRSKSVYAPLPEGQARALRRAYEAAGYGPDTVELVEAHGTATKAGDVAEFEGLQIAFGEGGRADRQWCALGSVKSQIGHTKSAAGAAGLFKAVMALHHKVLPPTIKVDRPNPKLEIEKSPFYLNTQSRPWIRGATHPRRASVSSFGFGGSNFHVTLEEYTGPGARAFRLRTSPTELVVLSAESAAGLAARCEEAARKAADAGLAAAARASQAAFRASDPARLAVVASDADDLRVKLEQARARAAAQPDAAFSTPMGIHYGAGAPAGSVAFLFPGQGSQYVGMGADVAMGFDAARAVWDEAAATRFEGAGVHDVVFPRPGFTDADRQAQAQRLTSTEWAQPSIGLTSLALLAVLRGAGVSPEHVGGHSFGEITALCAAGALAASDLVAIARRRGELMRDASTTPGAMTAVARPIDEVRALLVELESPVVVANHNHPAQVVLSGAEEEIARVERHLAAKGVTAKRLPVATAFHSPLVAPSSGRFAEFLAGIPFATPSTPVWSNADAAPYPTDAASMRALLAEQIARPVRFVEEIEGMWARGARTFVEVGPGSVLTELVGRILQDRPHAAVALDRKGKHGVTSLQEGLGRLAVAGVAVDFAPLWDGYAPEAAPKKKPAMTVPINGANYAKPYPPPGGAAALPRPNPPRPKETPAAPPAATSSAPAAAPTAAPTAAPAAAYAAAHTATYAAAHAAAPTAAHATAPTQAAASDALPPWVRAYEEYQRHAAESHAAYLKSVADTHATFLRTVETSFSDLSALVGGQPLLGAPSFAPPAHALAPLAAPMPLAAPAPPPAAATPAPLQPLAAPAPPPPAAAVAATPAPAVTAQLEALMLAVVAEKTGYPAEMLDLHMELEADLGVDSIKRVEILSAVRERAPGLPEVNPAEMAALRTLGQTVDYLRSRAPQATAAAPAPAPSAAAAAAPAAAAPALAPAALEALMLAVVAEKTGYPAEMLALHMELEADLGVDSIKRVEILSAVRERAPGLPEVNPAEMAALRTLGQTVDYLRSRAPQATAAAPAPAPSAAAAAAPAVAAPALAPAALEALMLAVVAEKTGYPAEMLALHMELEADLGVDSIKRVEILSAVRERAPGLPEVNPAEMAALRTLGQTVDYLRKRSGAPPAPRAEAPAAPKHAAIERFVLIEEPAPAPGLTMSGLLGARRVVVTDDGGGVAPHVALALSERGVAADVVASVSGEPDAVIFLGGLRQAPAVDDAVAVNREAFMAARAVAPRFTAEGGVFVTVQDTGGDFGLSGRDARRAWLAGVSALARTAALEWPSASVKSIDVERGERGPEEIARAIVDELFTGGATREVGLHADGSRTTLRCVPREVAPGGAIAAPGDVVVVSGGGRGVTAASIVALARRAPQRIVLLGRSRLEEEPPACRGVEGDAGLKRALLAEARSRGSAPPPAELGAMVARVLANREIRATLDAIRAAGSEARYVPVDVKDAGRLRQALDEVRESWGPITGLVHGAGVLADKLIAEKTPEQFDRVFDTKVGGLRALLDATEGDPLRWIALFSSVAARAGNLGQCDYAMANEVLNKVAAAARRARGGQLVAKAIGWGPWEGGMVTPELKARFDQMNVALLPIEEGARRFVEELEGSPDEVETVVGGAMEGGPLGAASAAAMSVEVAVNGRSHPYLGDHRVGGRPVVPVAMAIEWFARATRSFRHDAGPLVLRDLKVLRGIKLEHFENGGDRLTVLCKPRASDGGDELSVELRGRDGALHYSATADVSSRPRRLPERAPDPSLGAWRHENVYDGHVLFHGPSFQVVRRVDGVSREGIVGSLTGTRERGWSPEAWRVDAAALDGALQLALLWSRDVLGGASLPMSIAALESFVDVLPEGPIRCVVHGRQVHEARAVCDVTLEDASGRPIAALRGVETILRPGEAAARNRAQAGVAS
ncbi:SDR family oxidoreductase [Sorangium sp. So ce1099]|uniref:SDR family oxidoreductase n=1 Tax=Sorangium sp. So ce1099 TaxID=3133331 RepID=UPI003F5E6153